MAKNGQKSEYHKLKDGLAIRKVPQSKNYGIYLKFPNQKPLQFSLRTADYDEAVEKAMEEYYFNKMLLSRGEKIRQPRQKSTVHKIIDELIKVHEKNQDALKVEGKEKKHETHIRIFKRIKQFYNEDLNPSALEMPLIRAYFEENQPFSTTQLRVTKYCFNEIFDRSVEKKLITKNDVVDLKKIKPSKKPESRKDHFTYSEFSKVVVHAINECGNAHGKGQHTQRMAILYSSFLFYSGVRAGAEALGITWGDLNFSDFGDLYCTVREGKTKNYTRNNRNVILDHFAEETIHSVVALKFPKLAEKFTKKEAVLFLKNNKAGVTIFSTNFSQKPTYPKIFKKWIDELKETKTLSKSKDLTLYSLRHSYITIALENNVPIPLIAENAGTSGTMIERHYSHITVLTPEARKALLRDKIMFENGEKMEKTRAEKRKVIDNLIDNFDA
ncbi:TPA: tyrosine-type recombinase/integrase [Vibrio parahaemolyticus]|uniref:tyrosine-type recombinase/integrase n=3 Tax=Vibrio parahaemolyticus TaxID=670 RepID=UPI001121462B|nr:tyrosine-type recombinase/integrase [Vibrio parahaemolyticus]EIA1554678.1 tyrosine-type recombinase/integrase [Vibrio parahaemolyticus]EJG0913647.1 tyrosine-type recombinase/integrase [Vibrio parahaemolyticus]TOM31668.1 hypothetical protein CGH80_18925 [Vibrio parahaemolyticus]